MNNAKLLSPKTIEPSEADIQKACNDLLILDGWRIVVTDPKHLRGLGVSEPGMPDNQYIRYKLHGYNRPTHTERTLYQEWAQVMWIEWKRRDRYSKKKRCWIPTKAGERQREWHQRERARGALTLIAGEDFDASIEAFRKWYAKSGLQHKAFR